MVSESKRKCNDKYNSKCDSILLRPLKPIGEKIRSAAAGAGKSLQGYILDAVDRQIAYDETGENEIDPTVINNLITWLEKNNHTKEEILDCIKALSKKE